MQEQNSQNIKAMHIRLDGYIDSETCIDFEESMTTFLDQGRRHILLDCRNLKYVSDAGIGALISTAKKFEKNRACLVFYDLPDELSRVINFLNISETLLVAPSKDNALELLKKCAYNFTATDADEALADEIDESLNDFDKMLHDELEKEEDEVKEKSPASPAKPLMDAKPNFLNLESELNQIGRILDDEEGESSFQERVQPNSKPHGKSGISYQIIECANCGQLSKVRKKGKYSCPRCLVEFVLGEDGLVSYE